MNDLEREKLEKAHYYIRQHYYDNLELIYGEMKKKV